MKTEEQIREKIGTLMNTLKRLDVSDKTNDRKIFAFAAALRELDWVLEDP